ncbi:MAG: type 1 glutamine amidotransferase [Rhodospirillales bacterium]|nr:type 1 glutamine amidotransferase [Rhodospirillales bacterium]
MASRALSRPLIGVTSSRRRERTMWFFNRIALWRAGARSRRLCATTSYDIDDFDGFVIGGGDDIDATLYGGRIEPSIRIDRERDAFELDLLAKAAAHGLPLLGICRGAQMINVFLGGLLHESIYAAYPHAPRLNSPLPSKSIDIAPDSMLYALLRSRRQRVNALHHQSINVLGRGLTIAARDQYGIVQAIERPGQPFLLAVQWHPEFMLFNRRHQRLFNALVEAARCCRQLAPHTLRAAAEQLTASPEARTANQ